VLVIKEDNERVLDISIEKVSKFYDIETLTEDRVKHELKGLYSKYKQFNEVLSMMENIKGQHTDLLKFYEDRDIIGEKIITLENYYGYRRNFFVEAILKKKGVGSVRYNNFDDWEVK